MNNLEFKEIGVKKTIGLNKIISALVFSISALISQNTFGNNNCEPSLIKGLSQSSNISEKNMCNIMISLTTIVEEAQKSLDKIGSSSTQYVDKIGDDGLIQNTVRDYFINSDAIINTSNGDYYIQAYFQHISDKVFKGYNYKWKLIFNINDIEAVEIKKVSELESEMKITASNYTTSFIITENSGTFDIKISYINATDVDQQKAKSDF